MDEEMEVIDFNGVLEDDGAQEKPECDAWYMKKADVDALLGEVTGAISNVERLYDSFIKGGKLDEMRTALTLVVNELRSGRYRDFARNNPWLKKESYYLSEKYGDNAADDRQAVLGMFKLATKGAETIDAVCNHIDYFNRVYLTKLSEFFNFHNDMTAVVSGDFLSQLDKICHEYDYFINKFLHGSIYDSIEGISKDRPYLDNYKLVTQQMIYEISLLNNLNTLIPNGFSVSPMKMNVFYVVDRITGEYSDFEDTVKNGGDTHRAVTEKLIAQISDLRGQQDLIIGAGLLNAVKELLTKTDYIFLEAGFILEKYRTSSDAPYAVMRYSQKVRDTAEKNLFMSLNDPARNGTNYCDIAKNMTDRNFKVAELVAKQAP